VYFQVLQRKEFSDLVLGDVAEVHDRDDTDTIDIIDSIRFHITNFIQTYSDMQDADENLKIIDDFLMTLGLEC